MRKLLQILPFVWIFSGSAFACSCAWNIDHAAQARMEIENADAIFQGVLVDVQRREMKACVPGESEANWTFPKGLVKVTRSIKGVQTDALVVVEFLNAFPTGWDEKCDVNAGVGVTSCQEPFDPRRIKLPGEERWWIGSRESNEDTVRLMDGFCGPSFYGQADELYPVRAETGGEFEGNLNREGAGDDPSGVSE
ncbi:MAG: hypothetical protein AAF269_03425 [Pseudomonadota bacterium]